MNPLSYLLYTNVAYAADSGTFTPVAKFVGNVDRLIVNPLIVLLFGCALAYFLWGIVQFLIKAGNPQEREVGKSHMIWGVIGMFIMFSVFVILRVIETTLGVPHNANIPSA
jgi:succinate dehydrogenase/fumarate reductase cytochrome b subunit